MPTYELPRFFFQSVDRKDRSYGFAGRAFTDSGHDVDQPTFHGVIGYAVEVGVPVRLINRVKSGYRIGVTVLHD